MIKVFNFLNYHFIRYIYFTNLLNNVATNTNSVEILKKGTFRKKKKKKLFCLFFLGGGGYYSNHDESFKLLVEYNT